MKRQRINPVVHAMTTKKQQERIGVGRKRKQRRKAVSTKPVLSVFTPTPKTAKIKKEYSKLIPNQEIAWYSVLRINPTLLPTQYSQPIDILKTPANADALVAKKIVFHPKALRIVEEVDALIRACLTKPNESLDELLYTLLLHYKRLYRFFVRWFHAQYWNETRHFIIHPLDRFDGGPWHTALVRFTRHLAHEDPKQLREIEKELIAVIEKIQSGKTNHLIFGKKVPIRTEFYHGEAITKNQLIQSHYAMRSTPADPETEEFRRLLMKHIYVTAKGTESSTKREKPSK